MPGEAQASRTNTTARRHALPTVIAESGRLSRQAVDECFGLRDLGQLVLAKAAQRGDENAAGDVVPILGREQPGERGGGAQLPEARAACVRERQRLIETRLRGGDVR